MTTQATQFQQLPDDDEPMTWESTSTPIPTPDADNIMLWAGVAELQAEIAVNTPTAQQAYQVAQLRIQLAQAHQLRRIATALEALVQR